MENIRKLFYDDVREKSRIAHSSHQVRTKIPILLKDERSNKMDSTNVANITTAEQYKALTDEEKLDWLEKVYIEPGFKAQGKIMGGLKYYWFSDKRRALRRRLGVQDNNENAIKRQPAMRKQGYNNEDKIKTLIDKKIGAVEARLISKITEQLQEIQEKSITDKEVLNKTLNALEDALKEVRGMGETIKRTSFEGGYFIKRVLDAEKLSKRLTKLADSVGITDSKYNVEISIVELENE